MVIIFSLFEFWICSNNHNFHYTKYLPDHNKSVNTDSILCIHTDVCMSLLCHYISFNKTHKIRMNWNDDKSTEIIAQNDKIRYI